MIWQQMDELPAVDLVQVRQPFPMRINRYVGAIEGLQLEAFALRRSATLAAMVGAFNRCAG